MWVLQSAVAQQIANYVATAFALGGVKIGVSHQHKWRWGRWSKVAVQEQGPQANFIGIAQPVTILWSVKHWWASGKQQQCDLPVRMIYGHHPMANR